MRRCVTHLNSTRKRPRVDLWPAMHQCLLSLMQVCWHLRPHSIFITRFKTLTQMPLVVTIEEQSFLKPSHGHQVTSRALHKATNGFLVSVGYEQSSALWFLFSCNQILDYHGNCNLNVNEGFTGSLLKCYAKIIPTESNQTNENLIIGLKSSTNKLRVPNSSYACLWVLMNNIEEMPVVTQRQEQLTVERFFCKPILWI